jgi:hypothetical protein
MEYTFLMYMHSLKFDKAREMADAVKSHYHLIRVSEKDKWDLYANYAQCAIEPAKNKKSKKSTSIPNVWSDKEGYNIANIILELLCLYKDKDFSTLQNRLDALYKYKKKYFSGADHQRVGYFLKILRIANTYHNSPALIRKHTATAYKKLLASQMDANLVGLEILPFEYLYEKVICK